MQEKQIINVDGKELKIDTPQSPGATATVEALKDAMRDMGKSSGPTGGDANSNVSHVSPHGSSDTLPSGGAGYGSVRDMGDGTVGVGDQTH